jgi:hypothetical protein
MPADTSPAQDVEALCNALYATVRTPEADDMPYQEIARAFDLALHKIRVDFLKVGRVPPEPLEPLASSR